MSRHQFLKREDRRPLGVQDRNNRIRIQKTEFRSLSPKTYRCSFLGCLAYLLQVLFPLVTSGLVRERRVWLRVDHGVSRIDGIGRPRLFPSCWKILVSASGSESGDGLFRDEDSDLLPPEFCLLYSKFCFPRSLLHCHFPHVNVDLAVGSFAYINDLKRALGCPLKVLPLPWHGNATRIFNDDARVSSIQQPISQ